MMDKKSLIRYNLVLLLIIFLGIKLTNLYRIINKNDIFQIPSANSKPAIFKKDAQYTLIEAREGLTNIISNEKIYMLELILGNYKEIHGFTTKSKKINLSEVNKKILIDNLFSNDLYFLHYQHTLKFRLQCDLYVKFSVDEIVYEMFISDESNEVFIFKEGQGLRYTPSESLRGRRIIEILQ